jgi:acetyltransferase-like isoleucine patch superfamily enzyme
MNIKNLMFNKHERVWETSFLLRLVRFFVDIIENSSLIIGRAGYSPNTIAVYFRRKGAQIGEHCEIHVKFLGSEPFLVNIGNNVYISGDVVFHTHDGGGWIFRDKDPDIRIYGTITIEDNCMIGKNAHLLPNIRIGRNSIVGAGSVVISDVPPNSMVMGIPARAISSISKYEEKCFARWKEQRPPDLDMGRCDQWWLSGKNQKILRRHLTSLIMDEGKKEGEEAEK